MRIQRRIASRLIGAFLGGSFFVACVAEPMGPEVAGAPDHRAGAAEVAGTAQALGEAGCATVTADSTISAGMNADSVDNTFGHAKCVDGFVVDAPAMRAGEGLYMKAIPNTFVPFLTAFTCPFYLGAFYVYEASGGTFDEVRSENAFASVIDFDGVARDCAARALFVAQADGDYRVVLGGRVWLPNFDRMKVSVERR